MQIKPQSESDLLNSLGLINMFIEDLAEPFLNIKSKTLAEVLNNFPQLSYKDCSSERSYLNENQSGFIQKQIAAFIKRFKEVQQAINLEKSRQEDELHDIIKRFGETTTEKKEKYERICSIYEKMRWTGTL